jgi:hypothetical protein
VAARIFQLIQTAAVYGWRDTFLDQSYSFFQRSSIQGSGFIKTRLYTLSLEWQAVLPLNQWFKDTSTLRQIGFVTLPLIAVGLLILFFRRRLPLGLSRREICYPIVLLFAGAAFGGFVPVAGTMPYEGRQLIPFVCATIALIIVYYQRMLNERNTKVSAMVPAFTLTVAAAFFSAAVIAAGFSSLLGGWPKQSINKYPPSYLTLVSFAKELHEIGSNEKSIVFLFDPEGDIVHWNAPPFQSFQYQISPTFSFEADKLVLGFDSAARLIEDAGKLRTRTGGGMQPLIVGRSAVETEQFAYDEWRANCIGPYRSPSVLAIKDWFGVLSPACAPVKKLSLFSSTSLHLQQPE